MIIFFNKEGQKIVPILDPYVSLHIKEFNYSAALRRIVILDVAQQKERLLPGRKQNLDSIFHSLQRDVLLDIKSEMK